MGPVRAIPAPAVGGAILRGQGHEKELSGGAAATTNNRMELTAAIMALEALKQPSEVDVHTDSQYVRGGVTGWIHGWKRNGWRTADKKPSEEYGTLAAARRRDRETPGSLALGEGACRPPRKRARRCLGPRRDGTVSEALRRPEAEGRRPPRIAGDTRLGLLTIDHFMPVDQADPTSTRASDARQSRRQAVKPDP